MNDQQDVKPTVGLRTSDLDYELPSELIAQKPADTRDASRLLVVDRAAGTLRDAAFVDLPTFHAASDLIVLNDTKVVRAKLAARRATGGRIDGLFVRDRGDKAWEVLLRGRGRLKAGETLSLEPVESGHALELVEHLGGGRWSVRLVSDADTEHVLDAVGRTPLPPYIHRTEEPDEPDRERYQTIVARCPGAVAAPTAALHFTERVFADLDARNVKRSLLTLHVGPGTFTPIAAESLEEHRMHAEWFDLPAATAAAVAECRNGGGKVTAVGSTATRVLESRASAGNVTPGEGWTDIFIKPPHDFQVVDRLLTNFHLPRSTLLALVMAFAGIDLTRAAYQHAVTERYRFFSYGDAMLIL